MNKKENLLESRLGDYAKSKAEYHHSSGSATAFLLTASAAAGLGALICPPPAEAAVRYSGMKNLSIGTNVSQAVHNVDLDGDSVDDFAFYFHKGEINSTSGSYIFNYGFRSFSFDPAYGNSVIREQDVVGSNANMVPARLPSNYAIQSGLPVGGTRQWLQGETYNPLAYRSWSYYKGYNTTSSTMVTYSNTNVGGKFLGKRGYLGVRFKISNATHYGWIQFASDEDSKNGRILDWAYEDQPDTPILAGDGRPRFKWNLFLPAIVGGSKQRLEQNSN